MEILKFNQNVCKPCKELDIFLNNDLGVKADKVYTLDGEKDEDRIKAGEYGIMTTPVLVLLDDNGVEVDRVIGTNRGAVEELFTKRG